MEAGRPIRVLVVHRGLHRDRDEAREVIELCAGLVARAVVSGRLTVLLSDGSRAHRLDLSGPRPAVVDVGPHRQALRDADVVHLHMLLHWTHLLVGAEARLRGARVAFSPMSMLGRDFGRASWFRTASPARLWVKPVLVAVLRMLWLVVAHVFVAASGEEVDQARLPASRTVLVPLARPDSPLADAASAQDPSRLAAVAADAPIAFLTRFDVHRKGIDRLCVWLTTHADHLPRPAVVLLAPSDEPAPPPVAELASQGLLEWDSATRGSAVLPRLASCRAVMLLSRWDGQPRVLREAALAGIPTISTASSHFREVVDVIGSGAIVDGDDPESIQHAFHAVRDHPRDPELARRLFDRDRIGAHLHDLLVDLATGGIPSSHSYYDDFRVREST